jgi:hypothetical protein
MSPLACRTSMNRGGFLKCFSISFVQPQCGSVFVQLTFFEEEFYEPVHKLRD